MPASEIRGEGIFFEFAEAAILRWLKKAETHDGVFLDAHRRWREARGTWSRTTGYPGLRYVLLHIFAHAVIRQLSIECGYTTASIRERIYSRCPGEDGEPMAGVLIYTAAPRQRGDARRAGQPRASRRSLGRHLDQALEAVRSVRLGPPLCGAPPVPGRH